MAERLGFVVLVLVLTDLVWRARTRLAFVEMMGLLFLFGSIALVALGILFAVNAGYQDPAQVWAGTGTPCSLPIRRPAAARRR